MTRFDIVKRRSQPWRVGLSADVLLAVAGAAFLAVWTWFWTGPELEWERALQNAPKPEVAAEGAPSMAGSGRPSPNPSEPRT